MSEADRPALPPVRLPDESVLAEAALASPLLSRAARLAAWAERGVPVGAGGELLDRDTAAAAGQLDLPTDEDGLASAGEAWCFAVDTGLVEWTPVADAEPAVAGPGAEGPGPVPAGPAAPAGEGDTAGEETHGTATPGAALAMLSGGDPGEVLEVWEDGLEAVIADAATPSFESLLAGMDGAIDENGEVNVDAIDLSALDWEPEEEAEFLDSALGNLYVLTATDESAATGAMVPLPVLAASMVVPPEMEEPTDEVLREVSSVMMRLDEQFQVLLGTGLLEYHPVDEELMLPADDAESDEAALGFDPEEEDLTRYGQVRLTPLGLYGVRQRLRGAGLEAGAVGDLAGEKAEVLLLAIADRTAAAARAEAEEWLAAREPLAAARELLAAARGGDQLAPARRLSSQLVLSLAGKEAEPALREVLDDRELGGLARVWLTEHGAADVPPPSEDMVFWLTVDTIAAQLDNVQEEPDALRELVRGLTEQHRGFFAAAWQVDHPATAEVLDAVGRLHPDPELAKEARRAAHRARSQHGG